MKVKRSNRKDISLFLIEDKHHVHRHLLLQAIIFVISIGVFFDAPDKVTFSLDRFYSWVGYYIFLNMLVYVNTYFLFPRFLSKNRMFAYVISITLFTIFSIFILTILQELFYDIAVTHQQYSEMAVFLSIASSISAIVLFIGGNSTLLLFKQWIINKREINSLQVATYKSELNFLKSQINPHFLFNMINNANIMMTEDPKMASYILAKLDDILQYQFNNSTKENVLLKDDITFLTDFLDLEKVRRDHFGYSVSVKGNIQNILVPPILFIPFVENAVKHNLDLDSSYVNICFRITNNQLLFVCKNSKPSKRIKQIAGGLGLANIKRRLTLLFENRYIYQVVETETTYTVNLQLSL